MGSKDAFQQQLEAQLKEWSAKIDQLEVRVAGKSADARIEFEREIAELRARQDAARSRLDELRNAGNDAWEDMKAGVEKAGRQLGDSLRAAQSRFK